MLLCNLVKYCWFNCVKCHLIDTICFYPCLSLFHWSKSHFFSSKFPHQHVNPLSKMSSQNYSSHLLKWRPLTVWKFTKPSWRAKKWSQLQNIISGFVQLSWICSSEAMLPIFPIIPTEMVISCNINISSKMQILSDG